MALSWATEIELFVGDVTDRHHQVVRPEHVLNVRSARIGQGHVVVPGDGDRKRVHLRRRLDPG